MVTRRYLPFRITQHAASSVTPDRRDGFKTHGHGEQRGAAKHQPQTNDAQGWGTDYSA
jgi:hypothetical protein